MHENRGVPLFARPGGAPEVVEVAVGGEDSKTALLTEHFID